MALSLIAALLPLVLIVTVIIALTGARRGQGLTTSSVRRFFQYLLLAGLAFVAAGGLTGLLRRALPSDDLVTGGSSTLALYLALVVVGLPLWAALAWWTRRRLAEPDGVEVHSLGWAAYLTLIAVVSVIVAVVGWFNTAAIVLGYEPYESGPLAMAAVWTVLWAGHHWWGRHVHATAGLRGQQLLGSLAGLVIAALGLVQMLQAGLRPLLGLSGNLIGASDSRGVVHGAVLVVLGALVWVIYWVRETLHSPRDTGWLALVLLAGVGGGLVAALTSLSLLGHDVLVWLMGDAGSTGVREHFGSTPMLLAIAAVGSVLWWYHQEVLDTRAVRSQGRTEVRRVYEYLMSAVGLLTAAVGLAMIIVTVLEAVTSGSAGSLIESRPINTLLAAVVLLAVGAPVWLWHWRQAETARVLAPGAEVTSPTRRTYLLVLFGVAGVTAVGALLALVYGLLEDVIGGFLAVDTVRHIRVPLAILASASLISAYHWTVYRSDRRWNQARPTVPEAPDPPAPTPRRVLLIGPADEQAQETARAATGAMVRAMTAVGAEGTWPLDELAEVLTAAGELDVVIIHEEAGLRVIQIQR